MSAQNPSRTWSMTWLLLAVVGIPFLLLPLLFRVLDWDYQFEIGALIALLGLVVWIMRSRAGWQRVEKGTAVIRKGPGEGLLAFWRKHDQIAAPAGAHQGSGKAQRLSSSSYDSGTYLLVPPFYTIEALLPTFPFGFEFTITDIDTQTPGLARISKLRIRVDCRLLTGRYLDFYLRSSSWTDRIRQYETDNKLKRTDLDLWKKLLQEITEDLVDNATRDVVWRWSERFNDTTFVKQLSYTPDQGPGFDPYNLSRNRIQLEQQIAAATRKSAASLGIELAPLVIESIEIDPEMIKRATSDRVKEREKAAHEAAVLAEAIRVTGEAEAAVRAHSLAGLLDVLINKNHIPYSDPLIADLVRAALYKDGEVSWKRVIEKSANGDGTAKTA